MHTYISIIMFFILFLLCFTTPVQSTKHDDDTNVLLKIKKQLGDPAVLGSWDIHGFNYCNFSFYLGSPPAHVETRCTTGTNRVNYLAINRLDAATAFPDAVCGLTELEYLNIDSMPGLYGPIPSCIGKLVHLTDVIIQDTSLSGSLPAFSIQTNLRTLILARNQLSGTIPKYFSVSPNLNFLNLDSNHLVGPIPLEIVLSPSTFFRLSNNNLTGEIPKCLGRFNFTIFDVKNNRLSGDASFLFGKQHNTGYIDLSNNDFEFDFSRVEFAVELNGFDLSHNKIYGKVPDSLASSRLWVINLSYNKLCGELPQGGIMWHFFADSFANNDCLCGNPLPPCIKQAPAPSPAF